MSDEEGCRAYVQHIRSEHQSLERRLANVDAAFQACDVDLVTAMENLKAALVHHFAEEDAGGCVEEAVARCPSLGSQADALEAEHSGRLTDLEAQIETVRKLKQNARSSESLRRAWQLFHARLRKHEEAEDKLLAASFGCEESELASFNLREPD